MGELTRYEVCRPSLAYTENMEYGANLHIFEVYNAQVPAEIENLYRKVDISVTRTEKVSR